MATKAPIAGKTIVITGASSGIGRAAAIQLAAKGAKLLLVARREAQLNEAIDEIHAAGGEGSAYAVDLSDLDAVDRLGATLLEEHGHVDVLVNNAARSIRRPVTESLERYHDFERCMTLNFFSPVRLTRALLPSMLEAGSGHVINSGTWGTLMPSPGFAAYNASKAALDSFGSILQSELHGTGVAVTHIYFPLVHTAMSAPTPGLRKMPGMSSEAAGEWIVTAIERRPRRMLDLKTKIASTGMFHMPGIADALVRQIKLD